MIKFIIFHLMKKYEKFQNVVKLQQKMCYLFYENLRLRSALMNGSGYRIYYFNTYLELAEWHIFSTFFLLDSRWMLAICPKLTYLNKFMLSVNLGLPFS